MPWWAAVGARRRTNSCSKDPSGRRSCRASGRRCSARRAPRTSRRAPRRTADCRRGAGRCHRKASTALPCRERGRRWSAAPDARPESARPAMSSSECPSSTAASANTAPATAPAAPRANSGGSYRSSTLIAGQFSPHPRTVMKSHAKPILMTLGWLVVLDACESPLCAPLRSATPGWCYDDESSAGIQHNPQPKAIPANAISLGKRSSDAPITWASARCPSSIGSALITATFAPCDFAFSRRPAAG